SLYLAGRQRYYVEVFGVDGAMNSYNLSITKIGGSSKPSGLSAQLQLADEPLSEPSHHDHAAVGLASAISMPAVRWPMNGYFGNEVDGLTEVSDFDQAAVMPDGRQPVAPSSADAIEEYLSDTCESFAGDEAVEPDLLADLASAFIH